jgi:hypothetical protein
MLREADLETIGVVLLAAGVIFGTWGSLIA